MVPDEKEISAYFRMAFSAPEQQVPPLRLPEADFGRDDSMRRTVVA